MDANEQLQPTVFAIFGAWQIIMPILNDWSGKTPTGFPNYASGTWGPEAPGHYWPLPTELAKTK